MTDSRQLSRRRFLKGGPTLAVGSVASPYLIPSGVLAAPERPGANDRIGVGYIGVGRRGNQLMGLPEEARIVAACDVYRKRAEAVAAKRRCKAYLDYRKLLESKDVDAVVIATVEHWHALPSIHACQAGKDVYCEKPLGMTVREGRAMVTAARKYKRVFQTGSQQRSMAPNRIGCELVRSDKLGKVHTVIGYNYPSPWLCGLPAQPAPEGLDWDMWCGPTLLRPYHEDIYPPHANPGWIGFQRYSGGEMTSWGAHGLDQVQWALGMDHSGPVEVWTDGEALKPPVYSTPKSAQWGKDLCSRPKVFFRYANGVVLKLEDGPMGGAIFVGEKAKIEISRGRFNTNPPELGQQATKDAGGIRLKHRSRGTVGHLKNWVDCIKSREQPVADVEIGHRSATVCHLGNIARWLSRRLRWNPDKETFSGDDEANAYLDRPGRKPYKLPDPV